MLSVGGALALYGFVVAAMLSVGSLLNGHGLPGIAASEWLCVAAPTVGAIAIGPGRSATVLGLARPSAVHLAGAILVGASAWIVVAYGVVPLQELVAPAPRALTEALERVATPTGSPVGPLLAIALTPGICEELLCRGAIQPALRARFGTGRGVLIAALLFAALHLSLYRFVPTFLLGLSYGALAVASGSIVPAMVAHTLNNAAVVLASSAGAARMRDALDAHRLPGVGLAVIILTIGHILVSGPRKSRGGADDQ